MSDMQEGGGARQSDPHDSTRSRAQRESLPGGAPPGRTESLTPRGDGSSTPSATSGLPPRFDQPTVVRQRDPLTPRSTDSGPRIEASLSLVGERLEHFELLEFVGGGGMGAVFKALDTRLDRIVALKILAADQTADEETVRRFRNEAQSAARLDHENIARVYYVGEDRGLHFIALEFIEGSNLRDLVAARGPLPLEEALRYTLQIAEALAHASGRDVVHRDIKPSNVLITAEGRAKLVDMGLARLHQVNTSSDDLTASGVTLGTFDYISPEQARDPRVADVRSDIYSLGCTLYFMLCGRPPFPDGTVLQKLLQHQADEPSDPRQWNPALPDEALGVLFRMLAKDPSKRYQTAGELAAELVALARSLGLTIGSTAAVAWQPLRRTNRSTWRRHLPWAVPVGALLIVVAILQATSNWDLGSTDAATRQLSESPPGAPGPPRINRRQLERPSPSQVQEKQSSGPLASGDGVRSTDEGASPARDASSTPVERDDSDSTPPAPLADDAPSGSPLSESNETTPARADPEGESGTAIDAAYSLAAAASPESFAAGASVGEHAGYGVSLAQPAGSGPANSGPANSGPGGTNPASTSDNDGRSATSPATARADRPADSGVPATPRESPPRPVDDDLLIVGAGQDGERHFVSVEAACAAASDGDVIELRFDGPRRVEPLQLSNVSVTVRAGAGYRPMLEFRPMAGDPLRHQRSMLRVTGGALSLVDVALHLEVPREAELDEVSLFELRQVRSVKLERCWVTVSAGDVVGAWHEHVRVFDVRAAIANDGMMVPPPAALDQPVRIRLEDAVIRGDAVLVYSAELQPISLEWDNGLLALSERLLVAQGGQVEPTHGGHISLDLDHVTAVARRGLLAVESNQLAPYQLVVQAHCRNSILMVDPGSAFIEQRGIGNIEWLRSQLLWDGERNFYEGFDLFRVIVSSDPLERPYRQRLSPWLDLRGGRERSWGHVAWATTPELTRPLAWLTPADFALEPSTDNPGYRRANDGRNVGLDAQRLLPEPLLPPSGSRPHTAPR